jgi:hypothetical protein
MFVARRFALALRCRRAGAVHRIISGHFVMSELFPESEHSLARQRSAPTPSQNASTTITAKIGVSSMVRSPRRHPAIRHQHHRSLSRLSLLRRRHRRRLPELCGIQICRIARNRRVRLARRHVHQFWHCLRDAPSSHRPLSQSLWQFPPPRNSIEPHLAVIVARE